MGARRWGRLAFCAGALAPRLARTSVAETTVFEVTTVRGAGALAAPVLVDVDAGCLDGAGIARRFGDRCVTLEADALATCAALANCVAVQCLPAAAFSDLPDRVGLDAAGAAGAPARRSPSRRRRRRGPGGRRARAAPRRRRDRRRRDPRRTPLMAAANSGDSRRSTRSLAGASTLAVDFQGLNAMDFAVNNLYATTQGGQRAAAADPGRKRREEILRDRNDAPVTGGAASADAVPGAARRRGPAVARAAALLDDGVDGRVCVFAASHETLAPGAGDHALCDPNATPWVGGDAPGKPARVRAPPPHRDGGEGRPRLPGAPGAASRAITDAARADDRAVYDAAARRVGAAARGPRPRRAPAARRPRRPARLAVVPGAALQTCAPACKSKAVRDATATWDADALIVDESDGSLVGHGNYNWSRATAGPGAGTWKGAKSDHAGRADWLAGVGSEDGGAIPLEAPLLPPFPWGS
ncbi:hypothetical protein JL722_4556 [Aureococcus anophagefferens]|nr:hypothetical protein JL722_4556 [Aureococcus anophagefferens]